MRSRKAFISMTSSLLLQIVSTVCAVILPRLFIKEYGSVVNATVASVTQFLSYIVLFEAGVGGVVRAALYKPLADKNMGKVSSILNATDNFFRKISYIFTAYTLLLAVIFPLFLDKHFDFLFTFSLILIIAFSTFTQYFFGLSRQVLLHADQKRYVYSFIQIFAVTANTVVAVLLMHFGASLHAVKIATAVIYSIRPLVLRLYVKLRYSPDKHATPDISALSQKWDGFGHHTAYFLHSNTDITVLTLASAVTSSFNITDISVYSVYYTIVAGIKNLVSAFSSGIESAFGNMIANDENDTLKKNFCIYEFISFNLTTVLFTCVGLLVVPFISVYTKGITDANYLRPAFAIILTLAEAVYCIRIPYNNVTLAAGHFKQTKNGAFAEAIINIVLSVCLVIPFGISGVAFATLVAMTFRTVQYALYLSKNILKRSFSVFLFRCAVNIICALLSVLSVKLIPFESVDTYTSWFVFALISSSVTFVITLSVNSVIFNKDFKNLMSVIKNVLNK